jgi:hypothetical protein
VSTELSSWLAPLGLTLAAATLSVVNSGLLLFLPLALLLIAVPPRRPVWIALGAALLTLALARPTGDVLWWVGRGWALIVGAWFVGIVALRPTGAFVNRGLAAVFGALASAALLIGLNRAGWREIDATLGQGLRADADSAVALLLPRMADRGTNAQAVEAIQRVADAQASVYPALLALASLAGLGVAWWFWQRLVVRQPRPLRTLREFRFRDELVWLAVLAVALIVLPLDATATRAGANLATFMGALYTLRGLGVLLALYGVPGPLGAVLGLVIGISLFPLVAPAMLMFGLSDTWLDLRARVRPSNSSE